MRLLRFFFSPIQVRLDHNVFKTLTLYGHTTLKIQHSDELKPGRRIRVYTESLGKQNYEYFTAIIKSVKFSGVYKNGARCPALISFKPL